MYIINLESKICPKFENAFWNSFFASIGWFYFRTHSVVQTNKWKKCFTNVIFVCVNLVRASFALAVLDTSLVYFLNKIFDKQSLPSPSTCYPRPCCLTLKLDNHLYYQHVMPACAWLYAIELINHTVTIKTYKLSADLGPILSLLV